MNLENVMESIARGILSEHIDSLKLTCQCNKCKLDILAITLNALPPRYIVKSKNQVYIKVDYIKTQYRVDVLREIANAARIVINNPQH